jgi:hypothetical protein
LKERPKKRQGDLSVFNKFTQAEAEMFRKFTHLMFSTPPLITRV